MQLTCTACTSTSLWRMICCQMLTASSCLRWVGGWAGGRAGGRAVCHCRLTKKEEEAAQLRPVACINHDSCSRPAAMYCTGAAVNNPCPSRARPCQLPVPQEQQRQGAGGSLMLFKHSIVVVDEEDRAWPVQVGDMAPAGTALPQLQGRPQTAGPTCQHSLPVYVVRQPPVRLAATSTCCCPPPLPALQYEGFMSAGQRHLRLGAGWRYLCRANAAAVGKHILPDCVAPATEHTCL
jgi:hypothetical protein